MWLFVLPTATILIFQELNVLNYLGHAIIYKLGVSHDKLGVSQASIIIYGYLHYKYKDHYHNLVFFFGKNNTI